MERRKTERCASPATAKASGAPSVSTSSQADPGYWDPYFAGIVLGGVLLASFLVMGFGLGSSGAANRVGIAIAHWVAPGAVEASSYFSEYVQGSRPVLHDWMVYEVLGAFLGGLIAAYSGGRLRRRVERGPGVSDRTRLVLAVLGGMLMGYGARLAHGCTSGQALTGGAALSVGSWLFMMAVFAGGYLLAPVVRRQWR